MNASSAPRPRTGKVTAALAATALAAGLGLAALATTAPPAQATPAGAPATGQPGLDRLHAYCQSLGHLNSVAQNPKSVWSWRCVGVDGTMHGINMHDACRWQHGAGLSHAAFHDERNAFSWYCY
ncbi:hypothetical protein AB0C33_47430 [Nonomuraea sp. NPDC048881]|uniref:hypothetical protein n=1 Tax=Nonomuraea sp. NPDC048881 TaxID=3155030 RepID=UPI0033C02B37